MQQDTCVNRHKAIIYLIAIGFFMTVLTAVTRAQPGVDLDDIWDFDQHVPSVEAEEPVAAPEPPPVEPRVPAEPEPEAPVDVEVFDFPAELTEVDELTRGELIRRQEKQVRAEDKVRSANSLLRQGMHEEAISEYREAEELFIQVSRTAPEIQRQLQRVDQMIANAYDEWVDELMAAARKSASLEDWEDARDKIDRALEVDPARQDELNRLAAEVRKMRQEIEFRAATSETAVDPDRAERRYDIDVLMQQGKVLYNNRRYMEAKEIFEQLLVLDPFSVEAMRRLRMIHTRLQEGGEERRLTVREEMLAESTWTWAQPLQPMDREERPIIGEPVERVRTDAHIRQKLQTIIFPKVDFEEATIHQVVRFLQQRSVDLDPANEGVNIVLHLTNGARRPAERQPERRAEPAWDDWDDWEAREPGPGLDDWGIQPPPETRPEARREPAAPPQDIGSLTLNMENVPLGEVIRFVTMSAGLRYHIETHAVIISDRELPEGELVTRFFPVKAGIFEGRAAEREDDFDPWDMGAQQRTTREPTAMDPADVRSYFRNLGVSFPEGASIHYDERISTLIVRNTERNIQEIESILEQINVRRSQVTIEAKFVEVSQRNLEGLGLQWMLTEGFNLYESSSGSRRLDIHSGDLSRGVRTIAQALSGTEQAGDILSATAILGSLELDVVLHALEQRGNADILSAPKVTTTSGNTALIRMVQERYFPEDWEEPEVTFDNEGRVQSIIPSAPIYGDARDIGVLLEVTPTVEGDGYTIGLDLRPEVIEFIGYDTELDTVDPNTGIVYRYAMPIIEARTIDTGVIVYNNETVVLGGMIKEEAQDYEDKVPVLGDIPLLGRLFRSRGSYTDKRNLLIFVTARLVDPAGQPIREQPLRGVPDFNR